jgi:hypothetical protein
MEPTTHSPSKWRLLKNTLRAVSLFKIQEVKVCSLDSLEHDINQMPTGDSTSQPDFGFREAVEQHRLKERFLTALMNGGALNLAAIQRDLRADPRRFMIVQSSSRSLVNSLIEGQTPLYIAAKNGYRDVVDFLLASGADHLALSRCDKTQETCLEVAVRWHYVPVIKELIKRPWPAALLKRCRKRTTQELRAILRRPKHCCI